MRGVDIKEHEFAPPAADEFLLLDLREPENCEAALLLEDLGYVGIPCAAPFLADVPGFRVTGVQRRAGL